MKPLQRAQWSVEDEELEAEFEDMLQSVREHDKAPPRVPGPLDRRVRRIAREAFPRDLQKNWFLGHGPLVILVVLILFAISAWILGL